MRPGEGSIRAASRTLALAVVVVLASLPPVRADGAPPAKPAAPAPRVTVPPPSDPATDLALAEKLYGDLDYERANLVAARITDTNGLTHDQLVRSLRILALTDAALGHEDQAREEFIELLTYSPDFQVDPNLGPRVTAPFLEARGFWRAQAEKPGVEVAVTLHTDAAGSLRVTAHDPSHIAKTGTVGFRWGSSAPYTTKPLTVGEGIIVDLPPPPPTVTRLDYYAQLFDGRQDAVMEAGSPLSPKSAMAPPPPPPAPVVAEKRSIFASPIFWTVTGIVVAGAVTTAIILAQPKSPTGASLSGAADCGPTSPVTPCH